MTNSAVAGGIVHKVPSDLLQALINHPKALNVWQSLTPISRNEWICWTISVKQDATRNNHVKRTISELQEGKRRPCCWMGCIHRNDKEISPSVQWLIDKRSKKR